MKLNINYNLKDSKEPDKDYSNITSQFIEGAVNLKYKEGLEGQKRRIYGRIQNKLEDSIEDKTYEIELEEAEKDFIKDCYKEAKYPPQFAKLAIIFEDFFINKLDKEDETK